MLPRARALVLVVALLAPTLVAGAALAHGEDEEAEDPGRVRTQRPDDGPPETPARRSTDTAEHPFLDYHAGIGYYGDVQADIVGSQVIRDMHGDGGDWIVWEDANLSDIYAWNVPSAEGVYVTRDAWHQSNPTLTGSLVVWEDHRNGHADVYGYDFETGQTLPLVTAPGEQRNPYARDNWVVWQDGRDGHWSVWALDRANGTTFRVSPDVENRDSDPIIVGDATVVWRTYRYNVWDVLWYHLPTGERGSVTADRRMEQPPVSGGWDAVFLQDVGGGWEVMRFDPASRELTASGLRVRGLHAPTVEGDHMVQADWQSRLATLSAYNLSNREGSMVSGIIPLMTEPLLHDGILYAPVWNGTQAVMVRIAVNPFAYHPAPRVVIDTPSPDQLLVDATVRVSGRIVQEGTQIEPTLLHYTLDGGRTWTPIPNQNAWNFLLDTRELPPGPLDVRVAAIFDETFPAATEVTFRIPQAVEGAHVGEIGEQYHNFVVTAFYTYYFGDNPGMWGVVLLTLALVALLAARWWLRSKPRRRPKVEYVRPDP